MDQAYQAKYLGVARMLWQASNGNPADIPYSYAEHLSHTYTDGSVSLVSLLPRFESYSELEDYEVMEAIEMLGKVNPDDWPDPEDVESVSCTDLLTIYEDCTYDGFDFAEDNLGTSEKVQKALAKVIESVLGDPVTDIRSKAGKYPGPDNNFLQEGDGTWAGSFKHGDHSFEFEIAPTEEGWLCTYRLDEATLASRPEMIEEDKEEEDKTQPRRVRNRGWK